MEQSVCDVEIGVCGIYCIENLINNKKYIGYSKDIKSRWYEHQIKLDREQHINDYLQHSWNKYGCENFIFYIIEECPIDQLKEREIYYIKELDTFIPNGYNLTTGGQGFPGRCHSDESKQKMSEAHRNISDETRRKMSIASTGRHHTDETKKKISESTKGENHPMWGKKHDEEALKKMRGRKRSPETCKKMSERMMGKKPTNLKQLAELSKGNKHGRYTQGVKKVLKSGKPTTSKYVGVHLEKKSGTWIAEIIVDGIKHRLGRFAREVDAAIAYNEAAIKFRGKEAKINIIDEEEIRGE